MAIFHFNLFICGEAVLDREGQDFSALSDVREAAILGARDLLAAEVKEGRMCLDCRIDVTDNCGHPVLTVAFAEAVTPYHGLH